MYHPGFGRFTQPDPIGYAGGANLYAYVGNDPLNWLDPFGLEPAHADTGGSLGGSWGLTSLLHGGLTALSFCPSICGSAFALADSGVYAMQGDWSGAGISALAAVAGAVSDAGAAKLAGLGLKAGVEALDAAKAANAAAPRAYSVFFETTLKNWVSALEVRTSRKRIGRWTAPWEPTQNSLRPWNLQEFKCHQIYLAVREDLVGTMCQIALERCSSCHGPSIRVALGNRYFILGVLEDSRFGGAATRRKIQ